MYSRDGLSHTSRDVVDILADIVADEYYGVEYDLVTRTYPTRGMTVDLLQFQCGYEFASEVAEYLEDECRYSDYELVDLDTSENGWGIEFWSYEPEVYVDSVYGELSDPSPGDNDE